MCHISASAEAGEAQETDVVARRALERELSSRIGLKATLKQDGSYRFGYARHMRDALPNAARAARECLALPIYPELEPAALSVTVEAIRAFYEARGVATGAASDSRAG